MRRHLNRRVWIQGESGFGLVEVMVTALVVVLVATATVSSIGVSQKQSSRTLARGISANLAEQDQDRMKAMRTTDLVGYTATRAVRQENVSYTVNSRTEFVQGPDGNGINCTSSGAQSSYLKLTTNVTPQASLDADPLMVTSFHSLPVAQFSPTSGTLIVRVVRADGITPQPSLPVQVTGPESRTATTNADGCAIFQFLTPGSYQAILDRPGFVDPSLTQRVTFSGTVAPAQISQTTTALYDRAGSLTTIYGAEGRATTQAKGITVTNSGITPDPNFRRVNPSSATGLFPFPGPYVAYSGRCDANNPLVYEPANFYDAGRPGNPFGRGVVPAAGGVTVRVHEPRINVTVRVQSANTAATPPVGANLPVVLIQVDANCGNPKFTATTKADGTLDLPFYPYGNYVVCAQTANGSRLAFDAGLPNTAFAGSPARTLTIKTWENNPSPIANNTSCMAAANAYYPS